MTNIDTIVQAAADLSVIDPHEKSERGIFPIMYGASAGQTVSPWWSPTRDSQLRDFWKSSDHLSGAVYAMASKMTAIPMHVIALDTSVREHVKQANMWTDLLYYSAEFGAGWQTFYSKWVEELTTQDNGVFAEIIGPGRVDGPLVGKPISVALLDSSRCTRTGDYEFPVVYTNKKGERYKLHYTRVMFTAQMPSAIEEMYGVGFCSVSRCINISQTLVDILRFKQEKMGSRPHRAIIITKGGLDPRDLALAFQTAEAKMDSQYLSRFAKIVVAGSASIMEASHEMIDLASLPDGFDEETSITLGMATIALGFGVDARELFPAMSTGATRADALLQHLKQRGKAPGQIVQTTEHLFNYKFLPPQLKMVFNYQDEAQDRAFAETRQIRSESRFRDLSSGAINVRTTRELMLTDREISDQQFERMELADGRLANGTNILALFYSKAEDMSTYLNLGIKDPVNVAQNDKEKMLKKINARLSELHAISINTKSDTVRKEVERAIWALIHLEKKYAEEDENPWSDEPKNPFEEEEESSTEVPDKHDTQDATTASEDTETDYDDDMQPSREDKKVV